MSYIWPDKFPAPGSIYYTGRGKPAYVVEEASTFEQCWKCDYKECTTIQCSGDMRPDGKNIILKRIKDEEENKEDEK